MFTPFNLHWFFSHATGSLRWDDEDESNINKRSGILPDGSYGSDTRIYFCCRNDPITVFGVQSSLKSLPRCSETILMRYKGSCPKVVGYTGPYTGFLQWDTEDSENIDERLGAYPDGQKTFGTGIKIEFCSYTSGYSCWVSAQTTVTLKRSGFKVKDFFARISFTVV